MSSKDKTKYYVKCPSCKDSIPIDGRQKYQKCTTCDIELKVLSTHNRVQRKCDDCKFMFENTSGRKCPHCGSLSTPITHMGYNGADRDKHMEQEEEKIHYDYDEEKSFEVDEGVKDKDEDCIINTAEEISYFLELYNEHKSTLESISNMSNDTPIRLKAESEKDYIVLKGENFKLALSALQEKFEWEKQKAYDQIYYALNKV